MVTARVSVPLAITACRQHAHHPLRAAHVAVSQTTGIPDIYGPDPRRRWPTPCHLANTGGRNMNRTSALSLAIGLMSLSLLQTEGAALGQEKPAVQMPKLPESGVPQVITMEGKFVRASYNNEGYVILGYQASNRSVGDEWMLLEVGMTLLEGVPDYTITRDAISLETPDGNTIPLPSIIEQRGGNVQAIQGRAKVQRDSINYFPMSATKGCALLFFPDLTSRALPYDQTELSNIRACLGRLYFKIPGGITYGQHWLNVKFQNSLVRVPFRILTKDEEKFFSKNYKSIEKQVKDAFKPKK
jgi:hypothetical protein